MIKRADNGWLVIVDDCPIRMESWDFSPLFDKPKLIAGNDLSEGDACYAKSDGLVYSSFPETKTANTEMSDDEAFDLMDNIRKDLRQE